MLMVLLKADYNSLKHMKTLLILFVFLSATVSFSQNYYEGNGQVTYTDSNYAVIVFGRNGYAPKAFTVKAGNLTEGKSYYFMIKAIKLKGSKATGIILLYHTSKQQQTLDIRRVNDSIAKKFIWI